MPMHDWTRVEAGIYHAFHHEWISEIGRALNRSLPEDYYALPEQQAAGFGPDVLTLQLDDPADDHAPGGTATATAIKPQTRFTAEIDKVFHKRKKSSIAVRHVSGDRIVAMVELVSPGNKSSEYPYKSFIDKACELLEYQIHLLIVDPFPPGPRDPDGVHAAIWGRYAEEKFDLPEDAPLTLVSYECDSHTRAYIDPIAVGSPLPSMPLFLQPHAHIPVPLEETYNTAFAAMPRRWARVLDG